jgi:hypothetical protein
MICVYQARTHDYRVYYAERYDLYVIGEDQYAAMLELERRYGRSNKNHQLQAVQGPLGGGLAVFAEPEQKDENP